MFRRRRPLLRGAMVAGGAYAVGKHVQGSRDAAADYDPAEEEQAAPATGAMSASAIDELKQLAELNKEGVLTDEEFAAQKQKLLGGG